MSKRPLPTVLLPVAVLIALLAMLAAPAQAGVSQRALEDVKYYVVQTEFNGEPEFLYEIAERFLGDGNRNPEIFELNKGRKQPGGLVFTTAAKIEPGWILQLPGDAEGEGVQAGPLPSVEEAPSAEAPAAPSPVAAAPPASASEERFPWWILAVGLVVLLAAGGAGFWLYRRRGRRPAVAPALIDPRDNTASWTADRALRALATACAQGGRSLPDVYAVTLAPGEARLSLSVPDDHTPAPWTSDSSGRTWTASLRDLQAAPVDPNLADPYPRLVTLGVAGSDRVLLDLGQANGLIGLDGDKRAQRAVVEGWTAELVSNPWSRDVRVVRCGFGVPLAGTTTAANLREALAALEDRGGVLFLASPASGRDAAELQAFLGTPGCDWSVVMIGGAREARWRFTAHADGSLDTGFLGVSVRTAGAPVTV